MRLNSTIWSTLALLGSVGFVACGAPAQMPQPGTLTVVITPATLDVADLNLASASMRLEHFSVFGDVAPPPHGGGPGMPMPNDVMLNALLPSSSFPFPMLPDGVYSRVQFSADNVQLQGTWRGMPFRARLAMFRGPMVDLRSATSPELGPGQDVSFSISVDPNTWFEGSLFDTAMTVNGQIFCDQQSNASVAMELTNRIGRSFSLR